MSGELVTQTTDLVLPGAVTETGLDLPDGLTFEQWERAGETLGRIGRACQWWIGDWLNYGGNAYGEKYAEALATTGYSEQSLMNMAWVAAKVPKSLRVERLSWSHHKAVAKLGPAEQGHHLADAANNGWSVAELGRRIKGPELESTEPDPPPEPPPVDQFPVLLRLDSEQAQRNAWNEAQEWARGENREVTAADVERQVEARLPKDPEGAETELDGPDPLVEPEAATPQDGKTPAQILDEFATVCLSRAASGAELRALAPEAVRAVGRGTPKSWRDSITTYQESLDELQEALHDAEREAEELREQGEEAGIEVR